MQQGPAPTVLPPAVPAAQVWWGFVEEGQPPKQIIEGGEYFVLKKLPSSGGH